jgi:ribosomal-protein-alanine N-acetyltransferase
LELVYLGLSPDVRGQGVGDWLMKLALWRVASDRRGRLSLAVDSANAPALALYYRHGMKQIGTRTALLRDLRSARADPVRQVQSVQRAP